MGAGHTTAEGFRSNDRTGGGLASPRPPRVLVFFGRVALLLGILATVLEIANPEGWTNLGVQPPLQLLEQHPWLGLGVVAVVGVVGVSFWSGKPLPRLVESWVRLNQYHDLDPHLSDVSPRALRQLVIDGCLMLDHSMNQLARMARVPRSVLWCIILNPGFLPRCEYTDRICKALLASPMHVRDGSGYGKEFITKRLMRYFELGYEGFTMHEIKTEEDEVTQLSMLSLVEEKRREDLGLNLPQRQS